MSRKRTDISERLLRTLQEIEDSDRNSNSHVNSTVVPEMDNILHPLISHHNGCSRHQNNQSENNCTDEFDICTDLSKYPKVSNKVILGIVEPGEDAVFQNSDNNLHFADQSFNFVVQNKLDNKIELLAAETSERKERFSTVSRNFKSKNLNLDDGHDDGGSGSGLSSVARQLENIRESQDAILADIRMDMEQLHMDNLALRENSAKLLAERNHYEKLYDQVSKNLQMMKEHIRQIQSSSNSIIVDVQLGDPIEPLPATKPEITKNCANHGLSGMTNYEPATLELQQQNRLAQEHSVVQEEGARKNGSESKPLSQYINVRNATLSTTTLNSLKGKTQTRKQLLSYSQTSEISQTESTLTQISGQSVTRLDSNNSSGSSNASSTAESILQVTSISNKISKNKGKLSKVKTGCFEFLRRRKNKKPKLAIETNSSYKHKAL